MKVSIVSGGCVALALFLVTGCNRHKTDVAELLRYSTDSMRGVDSVTFGEYKEQRVARRTYRCTGTVKATEDLYIVNTQAEVTTQLPQNARMQVLTVAVKKGDLLPFEAQVKRKKGFHQTSLRDSANWIKLAGADDTGVQPKSLSMIQKRSGNTVVFPSAEFTALVEAEEKRQQNVLLANERQEKRNALSGERAKLMGRQREIGTLLQKTERTLNTAETRGTEASPTEVRMKLKNDERMIAKNKRLGEINAEMTTLTRAGIARSPALSPELRAEYAKKQTEKRETENQLVRLQRDIDSQTRRSGQARKTRNLADLGAAVLEKSATDSALEGKRREVATLQENIENLSREMAAIEAKHTARLDELKAEQTAIQKDADALETEIRQEIAAKNEAVVDDTEAKKQQLMKEQTAIGVRLSEIAKALEALENEQ